MASVYGPGRKTYISGHEGLKIGLISLYRETGDRGIGTSRNSFSTSVARTTTRGRGIRARPHVRAGSPAGLTSERRRRPRRSRHLPLHSAGRHGGADGRPDYLRAPRSHLGGRGYRKTYVTGASGRSGSTSSSARRTSSNLSAWNETCASYGNVVWNHRMFLLHGDAQYLDQLERMLYNGFLVGVSLKGDRFFYQNPLMSYGNYERFDWINTPCCPPNVVRLIASLGRYIYATEGGGLYVNLFVGSTAQASVDGRSIIRQETRYPWDGQVRSRSIRSSRDASP